MGLCGKRKNKNYERNDYCHDHDYDCDCNIMPVFGETKPRKSCNEHCVEEVLKAIDKAQKRAGSKDECRNSCRESIDDLLNGQKKPKKNTIPFLLYCESCEPFKATGVTVFSHHSKEKKFACITSFIFRIKEFDGKCAVLELLTFKQCKKSKDPFKSHTKDHCSPCSQIDSESVENLFPTGICINVDLSCFCAVTCLPAVRL
ncbi:CotY/CotZ family spore coat protein [Cytobacillus firmus]|uniref:CotY/CotZ family spore coat protein n=2 Tax=Cytobacillus firmus TaxID=1399 RepID=UPI001C9522D3|nr:CotY/CotZ family spore coat protein [Cytobacillus firmus]MBY6053348.1 spore coat protein [Cytobacillus firmus]